MPLGWPIEPPKPSPFILLFSRAISNWERFFFFSVLSCYTCWRFTVEENFRSLWGTGRVGLRFLLNTHERWIARENRTTERVQFESSAASRKIIVVHTLVGKFFGNNVFARVFRKTRENFNRFEKFLKEYDIIVHILLLYIFKCQRTFYTIYIWYRIITSYITT